MMVFVNLAECLKGLKGQKGYKGFVKQKNTPQQNGVFFNLID
jgi:hypothetical protein